MASQKIKLKTVHEFLRPYRVTDGRRFRLASVNPAGTHGLKSETRAAAKDMLAMGVQWLAQEQEKLYAQDAWGVLMMFQAMDAAGKDGTIKHVMSGINPQGVQVTSFKAPSTEELDHDYLWRCWKALPERGRIGIFNRSYYEDVLVVRVHPELLAHQKIPRSLVGKRIWRERFEDICAFERYLARNGYLVLKFFLHVSRQEQKRRFLERLDQADKHWKFSAADVRERAHWDAYMHAYEDLIRHTATTFAPWYVVPADHKWFTRLVVAAAVVAGMERLKLAFPAVGEAQKKELEAARALLMAEKA